MSSRKIIAVITDALGDRVVVGRRELEHALEDHFKAVPQDILLELIERVLKDPTEIYRDDRKREQIYNFFYRLEKGPKFLVAVIKVTADGAFFASMYPTGKGVRNAHKNFKKVKL
jgi:hypothetical protein